MNAREFVAALRALRLWSGLSYRELTARARATGDSLPPSTITSMLGRNTLPRQSLIVTFVLACGLDKDAADRWAAVRDSIAAESERLVSGPPEPSGPPSAGDTGQTPADLQKRRRPWIRSLAVGLGGLGLVISIVVLSPRTQGPGQPDSVVSGSGTGLPAEGWYLIQPTHIPDRSLCIGEGRERNRRTDRPLATQRPCTSIVPDTYLAPTSINGIYEIRWHHPEEGVGCLTVDEALTVDGALVAPTECTGAPHQRYQLEPTGTLTPGGYQIRPAHSGLCLGILGGAADVEKGAEVAQSTCTGAPDQVFVLRPTTRSF